jgi:hypothetical protein
MQTESSLDPSSYPYSPKCVEGEFSEVCGMYSLGCSSNIRCYYVHRDSLGKGDVP